MQFCNQILFQVKYPKIQKNIFCKLIIKPYSIILLLQQKIIKNFLQKQLIGATLSNKQKVIIIHSLKQEKSFLFKKVQPVHIMQQIQCSTIQQSQTIKDLLNLYIFDYNRFQFNNSFIKKYQKLKQRQYLVLINPKGGKGNSQQIFNQCRWLYQLANIKLKIIITKKTNDGFQIAQTLKYLYDGYILCSGDGLVHQFLNGLLKNQNKQYLKIPLILIPGGSGNALTASACLFSNLQCCAINAAYLSVKGFYKPMNLSQIKYKKKQEQIYSFLSIAWGLLGSLDIKSEKLRFLGDCRFDIYAAIEVLFLKKYKGQISFSLQQQTKQQQFNYFLQLNLPCLRMNSVVAPLLNIEQNKMDIQLVKNASRWQLTKYLLDFQKGIQFDLQKKCKNNGIMQQQEYNFEHYLTNYYHINPIQGTFVIDGQLYPLEQCTVEISKYKYNLFILDILS